MSACDNKKQSKENPVVLEVCGICKTFHSDAGRKTEALKNASFTVRHSEFVTVVGATGCGKTTLLNIIAGLDTPDNGQLRLCNGLNFGKNIAYVFQHYTLFPWRTILGNVSFGLQMRRIKKNERKDRARQLIYEVGLEGFEDAYPHELSGGMRQRAAIAQALAIQPKLLLMDEPFGALDDSTRTELQQMLTGLWRQHHMTILLVTHNIDEALMLGEKILVFTERPEKIAKELKINMPGPRNKTTKEFTELFIKVRQLLSTQPD